MNNKSKFKKSLKYGAIMIVVGLVMMLIHPSSLFGDTIAIDNPYKIEDNDPITTWTHPDGCTITGVKIHAGYGQTYSGIITSSGYYGHIIRDINGEPNVGNLYAAYVRRGTTVPEGMAYIEGYHIEWSNSNATVTVTRILPYSKFIHGISWVEFYYTCDQSPVGQITVHKSIDELVDGSTVFYFELYQGTTLLETKSITGAGSATFDAKLAAGTYTVKETNTGFVTSVSLDGTNFTAGSSIDVAITGDLGSESSEDVYFRNDPGNGNGTNGNGDEHCDKCALVVLKRDEDGHPIDGAVFEVDGVQKTIKGGKARWDDLECDTSYEVKEISPNDYSKGIHLGDCGERSTLRVVNKGEEGELEVLGIMEVLPFTGPAIPYSPFIGISTVLAGTFLYILSKPKKKR